MSNDTVSKDHAAHLAVAYAAFNSALDKDDMAGIEVWGPILIRAQNQAGIELMTTATLLSASMKAGQHTKSLPQKDAIVGDWVGHA